MVLTFIWFYLKQPGAGAEACIPAPAKKKAGSETLFNFHHNIDFIYVYVFTW